MNPLLIVRTDILSTLIILFFIFYNAYCSNFRETKDHFSPLAYACLGHDVMAFITEITVNSDTVPKIINDIAHILFFLFALMYGLKYFEYTFSLIMPRRESRRYRAVAYAVTAAASLVMIFSPIEYLQGNGTRYSSGLGASVCYVLGLLYFTVADVVIITHRRRINPAVIYSILPISAMTLVFLFIQFLVPEFLFSGAMLTLMAVGLFFGMENPVGKLQQRAFVDHDTQVWNRNCYEYDMDNTLARKLADGSRLIYVLGDINGLKAVNDSLGHVSGDRLIASAAGILVANMPHAFRIYRIGGDEFAMIYLDADPATVRAEVARAQVLCGELRFGNGLPVGMSFGVSERNDREPVAETVRRADLEMYAAKERYYRENNIERRRR